MLLACSKSCLVSFQSVTLSAVCQKSNNIMQEEADRQLNSLRAAMLSKEREKRAATSHTPTPWIKKMGKVKSAK